MWHKLDKTPSFGEFKFMDVLMPVAPLESPAPALPAASFPFATGKWVSIWWGEAADEPACEDARPTQKAKPGHFLLEPVQSRN
jgi:hypothetical protein